jgi:hypothetical protein
MLSPRNESHSVAVVIGSYRYNFRRVHMSLRMGPAMAAAISDHVWSVRELLEAAYTLVWELMVEVLP